MPAGTCWPGRQSRTVAPVEGATEVSVEAIDIEFEPASLDVVAGESIDVTVVNEAERDAGRGSPRLIVPVSSAAIRRHRGTMHGPACSPRSHS